ncbi:hypothetical protein LC605_23085 [Nostoc sp. CHAB 5836]|nr:hypothetical protein [Nostoc sp. CHAB 5836]
MAEAQRDRLSVDMRGMKAALMRRARQDNMSPSCFVRRALEAKLGSEASGEAVPFPVASRASGLRSVRLSLRLCAGDAQLIRQAARRASMPAGAYVAGLARAVPVLAEGGARTALLSALHESTTEMAALSRSLLHLAALLERGRTEKALSYREMLVGLDKPVRAVLRVASDALAEAGLVPRARHRRIARGGSRASMRGGHER